MSSSAWLWGHGSSPWGTTKGQGLLVGLSGMPIVYQIVDQYQIVKLKKASCCIVQGPQLGAL